MEAHYTGVSLGATVAGSKSWARGLDVKVDDSGIAVAGEGTQSSALPWSAVRHFAPGFTLAFPDGKPATEFEVTLQDRSLSFLVPADQLPPVVLRDLVSFATAKTAQAAKPAAGAVIPAPPSSAPYVPPPPAPGAAGRVAGTEFSGPAYRVDPKQKPKKKSRRRVLVGGGAGVVAAAVAAVVVLAVNRNPASRVVSTNTTQTTIARSTTTTKPPAPIKELPGPPASMSPALASSAVSIRGTDLKNWQVVVPAGQLVAGQAQELGGLAPGVDSPTLGAVVEPSFDVLQQCSGLPLDHLQLWSANYYAGGPPTYGTAFYEPKNVNVTQDVYAPEINAVVSEVASSSVQKSDIQTMVAAGFASCLESFLDQYERSIAGQEGQNVDNLKLTVVPIQSPSGVQTVDFKLSDQLVSNGNVTQDVQQYVVLGAGRLEQIVISDESINQPIPSGTWDQLIRLIQHRMQVVASKH